MQYVSCVGVHVPQYLSLEVIWCVVSTWTRVIHSHTALGHYCLPTWNCVIHPMWHRMLFTLYTLFCFFAHTRAPIALRTNTRHAPIDVSHLMLSCAAAARISTWAYEYHSHALFWLSSNSLYFYIVTTWLLHSTLAFLIIFFYSKVPLCRHWLLQCVQACGRAPGPLWRKPVAHRGLLSRRAYAVCVMCGCARARATLLPIGAYCPGELMQYECAELHTITCFYFTQFYKFVHAQTYRVRFFVFSFFPSVFGCFC